MNKEGPKQNQPKEYYKDGEGSKVQCTKITEAREFVQPRAEESEALWWSAAPSEGVKGHH